MKIIKFISAWDYLCDMVEDENVSDQNIVSLWRDMSESMEESLDDVLDEEFPNGADTDEIDEFFKTKYNYIRNKLGLALRLHYSDNQTDLFGEGRSTRK